VLKITLPVQVTFETVGIEEYKEGFQSLADRNQAGYVHLIALWHMMRESTRSAETMAELAASHSVVANILGRKPTSFAQEVAEHYAAA
jgi:hypothetical protein